MTVVEAFDPNEIRLSDNAVSEVRALVEDEGNPCLPVNMAEAIRRFSQSDAISDTLSPAFQFAYSELKKQELLEFERRVTDFELETYLAK